MKMLALLAASTVLAMPSVAQAQTATKPHQATRPASKTGTLSKYDGKKETATKEVKPKPVKTPKPAPKR